VWGETIIISILRSIPSPLTAFFLSYLSNDTTILGFTQRVARFSGAVPIDRGSAPDEVPNEPEVPISLFSSSHARSDPTDVDDSDLIAQPLRKVIRRSENMFSL
jgi:hypothetical protein